MWIEREHVDETSKMWKVTERSVYAESTLSRKHLKTTSEWPQSGPVIPLSSNEVVSKAFAFNKKGGTADNCENDPSLAVRNRQQGTEFFYTFYHSFPAKRKRGE